VIDFEESSGNVFEDLVLEDPDLPLARTELGLRVRNALRARQLGPKRAARFLKPDPMKSDTCSTLGPPASRSMTSSDF